MTTERKEFDGIRHLTDNVPIANPNDSSWTKRVYLFHFGTCDDTKLYVFANSLDDAFETAVEWLDHYAPELLDTIEEAEYLAAANELGLDYDEAFKDYADGINDIAFAKITELAECGMTMICHTTLNNGNCIPSWEWTAEEADFEAIAHSALLDAFPTVDDLVDILTDIHDEIEPEERSDGTNEDDTPNRDV